MRCLKMELFERLAAMKDAMEQRQTAVKGKLKDMLEYEAPEVEELKTAHQMMFQAVEVCGIEWVSEKIVLGNPVLNDMMNKLEVFHATVEGV